MVLSVVDRTRKNCTKVANLKELEQVKQDAIEFNVPWSEVTDAGHTQIASGTTTCISIGPAPEEKIDKITGDLKLYDIFILMAIRYTWQFRIFTVNTRKKGILFFAVVAGIMLTSAVTLAVNLHNGLMILAILMR